MKGTVNTDVILRAILPTANSGLTRGGLLSRRRRRSSLLPKTANIPSRDPAVNINPDVARKVSGSHNPGFGSRSGSAGGIDKPYGNALALVQFTSE